MARPPKRSVVKNTLGIVVVAGVAVALAASLTFCAKAPAPGEGGPGGGPPGGPGGAPGGPGGARGKGAGGGPGGGGGFAARMAPTVGVAKAVLADVPITASALGTVTPVATIQVQARVSGNLDKVGFKEGQIVRKGQLLAQIDPRPFKIAVDQAAAQLAHDEALLADARLDLQRYTALKAQDAVAVQTYDTQAALVKQDEATVANDRATLANARLNLAFSRVTSPVSGRVGLRQVDPGNQITANQTTPFTVVTQIDPITVVFSLPESAIGPIVRRGGQGLPVSVYDRSGGTLLTTGKLLTLDNLIDPTTGTVKAKAIFPNAGVTLFPNQFVAVIVLVDTLERQVVVPTTAVRHGPKGDFVWVLTADKTASQRPVKVGPGTAETVSIVSGLGAGEPVITDGGDRLRDGGPVKLPAAGSGAYGGAATPGAAGGHNRPDAAGQAGGAGQHHHRPPGAAGATPSSE